MLGATQVQTPSWAEFRDRLDWRQGEHVTLIGPTGSGKTTLALDLLNGSPPLDPQRWAVAFSGKKRDPVLAELEADGYRRIESWVVSDADIMPKVVLAPPLRQGVRSIDAQREVFRSALEAIYRQMGWTVYLDECRYMTDFLGLSKEVELLWQQGRSLGVSLIAGCQRPRHVPLLAYDQATHLFIWHNSDEANIARLREIGGGAVDPELVQAGVRDLDQHDFLYVNTRTGEIARSRVEF